MRVLVTGGAGFIGSHLVDALLARGDDVTVIDDLSTGRLVNIAAHQAQDKFTFVRGDIRDANLLQMLIKDADVVYHLAAAVGVQLIAEDPVRTISTNIGGTEVVLEMANKFRKKVFLASTSEVYGKSEQVPFAEDDDFVLGSTRFSRWAYACSKAVDEFLGQAYFDQYGLPVVIGRFFNTVGPRQTGQYGMVVPRFVRWALNNEPLQIYGDGQQARCFCFVGDVVKALLALMNSDSAFGKVFNIGSQQEITIEGLADRVLELTKSKSEKVFVSYEKAYSRPIEDMLRRVPDTSRVKEAVGWTPETSLDEILTRVIEFEKMTRDT
ncbi:GDP-mannose 4,6-dehydratase [Planctomycetota bacterium]